MMFLEMSHMWGALPACHVHVIAKTFAPVIHQFLVVFRGTDGVVSREQNQGGRFDRILGEKLVHLQDGVEGVLMCEPEEGLDKTLEDEAGEWIRCCRIVNPVQPCLGESAAVEHLTQYTVFDWSITGGGLFVHDLKHLGVHVGAHWKCVDQNGAVVDAKVFQDFVG